MKLPLPVLQGLEKAIDAVLRLDPETRQRLAALNGKTLRVNVTRPDVSLMLSVTDGRICVGQPDDDGGFAEPADTVLSGELMALRSMLDGNEALYQAQVSVEGDIGLSVQLKQIIAQLDPDWQDAISPVVGDGLTHRLDTAQSELKRWFNRTRQSSRHNISEYLQEEVELLAANAQVRQFCDDVDAIKAAADRLSARVQRLEALRSDQEK